MSNRPHIVLFGKGTQFWMGGREYTRNLVRALLSLSHDERGLFDLSLVAQGEQEVAFYESLRPDLHLFGNSEHQQAPYTPLNRLRWRVRRSTGQVWNPRLQEWLMRVGATFAYPAMTATASVQPFRSAEWIPDFQYKHFPGGSNPEEISGRKAAFGHIAQHAQTVVLSSSHAERDCVELFPNSKGKTSILRFRVFAEERLWQEPPSATVTKYNLPPKFMLLSNLLAPTKNHLLVLDALRILKARGCRMVVAFTGDIYDVRNPGYYNSFLSRIHCNGVSDMVHLLGLIPKADQFNLMRASTAVLQPSLFEGWHTGVEEAQLAGKTLVLSNIPVHVEQDPPARLFFDPFDAEAMAKAMLEAAERSSIGFEPEVEDAARHRYLSLQQQYARDFLNLAGVFSPNSPR